MALSLFAHYTYTKIRIMIFINQLLCTAILFTFGMSAFAHKYKIPAVLLNLDVMRNTIDAQLPSKLHR
jgi:hypothetical protein